MFDGGQILVKKISFAKSSSIQYLLPNPHRYNIFCQILTDTISFAKSLSIQYPLPNPYQENILCQILINTIFFCQINTISLSTHPLTASGHISTKSRKLLQELSSVCHAPSHLGFQHHNYDHHFTWLSSSS